MFCVLSVCNIFTTPTAAYHRPNLERAHKAWPNLYCTELYCTVPYCTVLYTLLCSSAQILLLSRSIYVAIHSNNDFLGFITVNFLEFHSRGEQRRMLREIRIFADTHTINQINKAKFMKLQITFTPPFMATKLATLWGLRGKL